MSKIVERAADTDAAAALIADGLSPLLARVYASRGIRSRSQLAADLSQLIPPGELMNAVKMAGLLADAIAAGKKMLIVADYDADGATACATGLRALRSMGAHVDYLVPNRFEYGYGLTPEIVKLAAAQKRPDILITVDNGIASIEGVAAAAALGIPVLITDHHLPGDALPDAWCIINPSQPGCTFPSKCLAGVGVMFYLMLALRAELRQRGAFAERPEPQLGALLDLVALGTVADVVRLDDNNRLLVQQGLQRMRSGRAQPGIAALFSAAGRDIRRATAYDLGFVCGPRLNAAGRLTDMSLGIECLTTDDPVRAAEIARELDQLNRQRRDIEADMQESALAALETVEPGYTLSLHDPGWHQGVIGILASRLRERFHRPVFAFADTGNGEIKGSGRSIPALHLRDALDLVSKRHPELILRFGGHAAAAGLTLHAGAFDRFREAFESAARAMLTPEDLTHEWITDGSLPPAEANLENANALADAVWGQGFAEPRFADDFTVTAQRIVGDRHLKLRLGRGTQLFEAMLFGQTEKLPDHITAVYRLTINHYNGNVSLQLIIENWRTSEAL